MEAVYGLNLSTSSRRMRICLHLSWLSWVESESEHDLTTSEADQLSKTRWLLSESPLIVRAIQQLHTRQCPYGDSVAESKTLHENQGDLQRSSRIHGRWKTSIKSGAG